MMSLFPDRTPDSPPPANPMPRPPTPRLRQANPTQAWLRPVEPEGLLREDQRACIVWAYMEGLDLTPRYADSAAVEGEAGRPITDPEILLALWL